MGATIKYLGVLIGQATGERQYAGPKRRFGKKMHFLKDTNVTQDEKAKAIKVWGLLVFWVVPKLVYPTEEVIKSLEPAVRRAMGIKPMGMTTRILQQGVTEG